MKNHYTRDMEDYWYCRWSGTWSENSAHKHRYSLRWRGWCRRPKTFNELRQNAHADDEGLPVRRRRIKVPTYYDDLPFARYAGKSWKDYTKQRRQWDR